MDKFLIVGLGNPGAEYDHTRHNTGFMVVDELAKSVGASFEDKRYGFVAETSLKGRKVFILKPTTYMNLSGNAVRYWLQKENIDQTRLLVVVDDLSIPLGDFRLKGNGSNGGHNGLGNIQQLIGQQYARLRRLPAWRAGRLGAGQVQRRGYADAAAEHRPGSGDNKELCACRTEPHDEPVQQARKEEENGVRLKGLSQGFRNS